MQKRGQPDPAYVPIWAVLFRRNLAATVKTPSVSAKTSAVLASTRSSLYWVLDSRVFSGISNVESNAFQCHCSLIQHTTHTLALVHFMNLNLNPALANFNNPFNNINRHPIARPLNLQDVAYALAEIKDGVARIENQLPGGHPIARPHPIPMFTNVTGQVHPQIGPERQQLHLNFHNLLRNLHPTAAQPRPQARRMRNANRNSNPCHACQVRKKRCSRMNGSPNVCERCHLAGLPACHPPPVRLTQDHVEGIYHEANNLGQWPVDHAKFMPSAQAPTTSSSIINNSDTKERPGNMMYDGNGNTQGLSCAAQLCQPTVKKEDSNWDEGVLIPSGQTLPYGSFEP